MKAAGYGYATFLLCALLWGSACTPGSHNEDHENEHDDHSDHDEGEEHEEGHEAEDESGDHEEDEVVLSEQAVIRSGIRIEKVKMGTISGSMTVPAEVQLNPERVAHVSPIVAGQLLEVRVSLGDRVEAGQTLALLRSVELGQGRAEYRRGSAMLKVAKSNLSRQKKLRKDGIASGRALLEAQYRVAEARAERDAADARLKVFGVSGGIGPDLEIKAPIAGVITARHATQGENVSPERNLFVISDTSTVWVIGRVYEQQVNQLRAEMNAVLTLGAYPTRSWPGTIAYTANLLDEATRSLGIRMELDNPEGILRPGLFGTLRLRGADDGAQLVPLIPESAVQDLRGQAVVFVPADEEHSFHAVPIVAGRRSAGQIEVLEGLDADAHIVVNGAFILKSQLLRSELGQGHAH